MKILLVNKFFYPRGGDCVVAISTKRLLESRGHEVRVFAMQHEQNIPLPESEAFAERVSFSGGLADKLSGARRIFGRDSVRASFLRVLDEFRPDVVHLHNIHSYLSPVVAELAHKRGVRVVWTLHDYKLICPSYSCRLPNGDVCEECVQGSLKVASRRCMKGSLVQSLLADLEARYWSRRRLARCTDIFIAPSEFMANKMMEGGFPSDKMRVVCNFIDTEKMALLSSRPVSAERQPYFCYVGRLSEEKGVETLLRAAAEAGVSLKLAGTGPLEQSLRRKYSQYPGIEFLGHQDAAAVVDLLANASASVLPSEWYENNPLGVIESLCTGTPVIGSAIGGIPELITRNNGVTFTPGNAEQLKGILKSFHQLRSFDCRQIAADALSRFNRESHYELLMQAYSAV